MSKSAKKNHEFEVSITTHYEHPTDDELTEYIIDAIKTWWGQEDPDGPLFDNIKNVAVKKVLVRR